MSGAEDSVQLCCPMTSVQKGTRPYLLAPVAGQGISRLFVPLAGSVVFLLQTAPGFKWNQLEIGQKQWSWLVQMSKQTVLK